METKSLRYVYGLGAYVAREDGNIVDHEGKVLKVYADGTVLVKPDGSNWQRYSAHRLVATAFVKNPLELPFVVFKDGNKADRRPGNLRWTASKRTNIPGPKMEDEVKPIIIDVPVVSKEAQVLYLYDTGVRQRDIHKMLPDISKQYIGVVIRRRKKEGVFNYE